MPKKKGDGDMRARKQTLKFRNRPYIISAYAIGGKRKREGPLHDWFDECLSDDTLWGKHLGKIGEQDVEDRHDGISCAKGRASNRRDRSHAPSGDLLNQLMSSLVHGERPANPFPGHVRSLLHDDGGS